MNFKDIKLLHEIEVIRKILWIRGQYVKLIFVFKKMTYGKFKKIQIKTYITFERLKINWFPLEELFIQ